MRKYFLTGLVLIIPADRAFVRLLFGLVISIVVLLLTCMLRLYKTLENIVVAIVIQLCTTILFIAGGWAMLFKRCNCHVTGV